MFKYKRVFKNYQPIDYKNIESYLESMALKGFRISSIKEGLFTFKRIKPQKIIYNISLIEIDTPFSEIKKEVNNDLKEMCLEGGWEHCCSSKFYHVFYWIPSEHDEPDIEPLPVYTDSQEEYNTVKNIILRSHIGPIVILVVFILLGLFIFSRFNPSNLTSNSNIIGILMPFIIALLLMFQILPNLLWILKNNYRLKQQKDLYYPSKRNKDIRMFVLSLFLIIYVTLILIYVAERSKFNSKYIVYFLVLFAAYFIYILLIQYLLPRFNSKENKTVVIIALIIVFSIVYTTINSSNLASKSDEIPLSLINNSTLNRLELKDIEPDLNYDYIFLKASESILINQYCDSMESFFTGNRDTYVSTVYYDCKYEWVADLIFNYYIDGFKYGAYIVNSGKYDFSSPEDVVLPSVDTDLWGVDEGYYLHDSTESVVLRKGLEIFSVHLEDDTSDPKNMKIIQENMGIN